VVAGQLPCPRCQDPGSGQKYHDITDLPPDLAGRLPRVSWPRYLAEPAEQIRALDAVLRLGFVLLADVPADPGLVDGFAAACDLRATDREAFDVLRQTPVPFGYIDKQAELRASQPLIQLSPRGRDGVVRFNNRSAQPARLPYGGCLASTLAVRERGQA
jgi:hypothetical protein